MITGPVIHQEIFSKRIEEHIKDFKYEVVIVNKSDLSEAEKVEDIARQKGIKTILGVGGGTVIDIAKFTAYKIDREFISLSLIHI